MDVTKHLEFFNPLSIEDTVHILGVGAIGSTIAEMVARLGIKNISVYDLDTVDKHNIANQVYFDDQIDTEKVTSIKDTILRINPEADVSIFNKGWHKGVKLNGYIFICIDNIDIRRQMVEENMYNPNIKAMFDLRMGLQEAQHFAADWSVSKDKEALLGNMDFSHDEAKEASPVSACGTTLAIIPTIRVICSYAISNFINFIKSHKLKKIILINAFNYSVVTI